MPAHTSTPIALTSEENPWQGSGWRAVEAQHKNATLGLVHGRLAEQAILEQAKPALPAEAAGLHFLLATPFRYPPPPSGSRFRAPLDGGVFYGAEDVRTACAEAGYWRWRFWMDSAALAAKTASIQMTLFEFHGSAKAMIDLTRPPLAQRRDDWIDPADYRATQDLAGQAREAGIQVIRYASVRDQPDGRCLAILTPRVFRETKEPFRHQQQSWHLFIQPPDLTVWQRSLNDDSFLFRF